MAGEFYPAAQQLQYPDILASYVRGQMSPMAVQQAQQQVTTGQLDIDKLRQIMRYAGEIHDQGARNQGGPTGGVQNGPQGQVSSQPPSDYGMPPVNTMMALDVLQGRDPMKSAEAAQQYQLKQAQLHAQGPLNLAEGVISSENAHRLVMNNSTMMQGWKQYAPKLGLDPSDPANLTAENAQAAATLYYNDIAGRVGLPPKAMRAPKLQDIPGGQVDPATGKRTYESLHPVIGASGQPVLLPESQAIGRQPFNPSIFGAANLSDQAVQFAADTYRTTGKMPAAFGRNPAMQAKVLDKVAADAQAAGDTTGAIAARSASLKANGMALDQTSKLESATSSYYNTLDKNLTNLQELAGKVDSSGVPLINKVYRAWQQGIAGDPDVAKYVTYLNSAASEFAKIQSGSLGNAPVSDAARKHADDVINKFMSQGQINAVAEAMRGEGNNRLSSIREQKQQLVGALGQNAPSSQSQTSGSPPARNSQGWVLHTDAKGNKAYVSPDGKQFEEVR